MQLSNIRIKNFLCFDDVELQLANQGLTLVTGVNKDDLSAKSNMTGKSSFFDAIAWCLYGRSYRKITGKEIIRDSCVRAAVEIGVNGKQVFRKADKGNPYQLFIDDKETSQEEVNRLLGMSWEQFTTCVMLGDDTANKDNTIFAANTNAGKFQIIAPLLNNDLWDSAKIKATLDFNNIDEQYEKTEEAIHKLEQENKELSFKQESLEKTISEFKSMYDDEDANYKEYEDKLFKELAAKKPVLAAKEDELSKLQASLNEQNTCYDTVSKEYKEKELLVKNYEFKREEYRSFVLVANKELLSKEQLLAMGTCPTCKQPISSDCEGLRDEITKTSKLKQSYVSGIAEYQDKINSIDLKKYEEYKSNLKSTLEATKIRHSTLITEISNLKERISDLEQERVEFKEKSKNREKEKVTKLNSYKEELSQLVSQLLSNDTQQKKLTKQLAVLEEERKLLHFWSSKGFSNEGAKSVELRSVIPIVNNRIQELLPELLGDNYKVELSAQRQYKSKKGLKNEIDLNLDGNYWRKSHSEKRRIDVVIQLALASMFNNRCNILMIDEFFSSLDSKGVEIAIEMFKNFLNSNQSWLDSIFVVSQTDIPSFDNKIIFQKENGITRLV